MKALLPLAVMQSATGGDIKVATAVKTGPKESLETLETGISTDLSDSNASFLDSLNGLLATGSIQDDVMVDTAMGGNTTGGNTLPLASNAAESSPPASLPVSTELQAQQDIPLMPGLLPGLQATLPWDADVSSRAAVFTDLSKMKPQTAAHSSSKFSVEQALRTASKPVVHEQTAALQAGLTQTRPGVLHPVHVPVSPIQSGTLDTLQQYAGTSRETIVKAGLMPQSNRGDVADMQPVLKTDVLLNETDRLFATRMQLATVSQAADLAGSRLSPEALLNTTQAASTDAVQASMVRSPIPQAATVNSMMSAGQAVIAETVGTADWGQGMGKQVLWMVNQNISRAEIRLNPANLGPIEVRIDMDNDQVNVAFTSRHAEVREAVEQALPRLREMLEEKGLNLSDADVSQHSFAEQHNSTPGHAQEHDNGIASGISIGAEDDQHANGVGQAGMGNSAKYELNEGLVDYYI